MAHSFASESIRFERPSRRALQLGFGSLGTFVASAAVMALGIPMAAGSLVTLSSIGFVVGTMLAAGAAIRRFFMRPSTQSEGSAQPGSIEVGEDAVRVVAGPEDRRFEKRDVKLGWVDGAGAVVLELRRGDRIVVGGLARDRRDALLRALDTTSSERVMETSVAGPYQTADMGKRKLAAAAIPMVAMAVLSAPCAAVAGVVLAVQSLMAGNVLAGSIPLAMTAVFMALLTAAAWAMVRFYRPRKVRVGTDGVRIDGVVRSRFLPHAVIDRVTSEEGRRVVLEGEEGRKVVLLGADPALAIRIRQAKAALAERRTSGVRIEQLDRGERDGQAWREQLADLTRNADRYRDRGLAPQQLLEVVEDAGCSAERRVAAAYALSHGDDDRARRRIRIAAEASADDALREALEEAAAGELSERKLQRCARPTR